MSLRISVIIPAFNVGQFVAKAILSAVNQEHVLEVIVIDDGSSDETLKIVKELKKQNAKIKFYQHTGERNKGRSASRNLGIIKSHGDYIAFLDADDYYLDNRFSNDALVFQNNLVSDGVYNAVGYDFYRTVSHSEKMKWQLNTISKILAPKDFFEAIISCKYGYLHLNGLTVKKTVFSVIGLFNEALNVAEDSDVIFKLAIKCRLYPGILNQAVAIRGIHDNNVFNDDVIYNKYNVVLYEQLVRWSLNNAVSESKIDHIFKYYWVVRYRSEPRLLAQTIYWLRYLFKNPKILFSRFSIKYFPLVRQRQTLFPLLFKR